MKIFIKLNDICFGCILNYLFKSIILIFDLIYKLLLIIISLLLCMLFILLWGTLDVNNEVYINNDVCNGYVTDDIGVFDGDNITNVVNREQSGLYCYFDEFIKLFRKDSFKTINYEYRVKTKTCRESFVFSVDVQSSSVFNEVLKYEVLRLRDLYDNAIKESVEQCSIIDERDETVCDLIDECSRLRKKLSILERDYKYLDYAHMGLSRAHETIVKQLDNDMIKLLEVFRKDFMQQKSPSNMSDELIRHIYL